MITTKQIKKMSRGERKAERQRMVSIEHLTELYRGGDHGFQNVVLAHRKCNQERNSRDQRGNELRVLRSRLYHYFGIPMSETQFLVR